MSARAVALASLSLLFSALALSSARAEPMDLALSRLSSGDCAATLGAEGLRLSNGGAPALRRDVLAYRKVASQLAASMGPSATEPVITSGPAGFDVSLETAITSIASGDEVWERASRGSGGATCAGRNDDVRPALVAERLRVQKGLPLGFSLAASLGKLFATSLYTVGAELKFALLEEVLEARVPDLAVRLGMAKSVGADDYSLLNFAFDVLVSHRFVVAQLVTIAPYLGAGTVLTRARTRTIDLTPNIDSVACRDGRDPVCNAGGLGASPDDLAHDVVFPEISLMRYRGFAGLSLRYGRYALSAAVLGDLRAPRIRSGTTFERQWTVSATPSVSF